MSDRYEKLGAKAVDDYHAGGKYRKEPPSSANDAQAASYREGATKRQAAYGAGHNMAIHGEGKPHKGSE